MEDKIFAGADTWATSYTLASAIKKIGDVDLVICGEKTVDGDTGQVGAEVAEQLNIPHVYYVSNIREVAMNSIAVISEMDNASYVVESDYPVLLSVTKDVNKPRLPTLKEKLKAMRTEIKIWRFQDISQIADLRNVGYSGSPTVVHKVVIPKEKARSGEIFKNIDHGIERILAFLEKR